MEFESVVEWVGWSREEFFCGLHLKRWDSSYDVMGRFGGVSVGVC